MYLGPSPLSLAESTNNSDGMYYHYCQYKNYLINILAADLAIINHYNYVCIYMVLISKVYPIIYCLFLVVPVSNY